VGAAAGLACLAWVLACGTAAASDSADERASLAGLMKISVVVEGLAPIADRNGLTTAGLLADVEGRLRNAGVPLTPDSDAYLYVHVTIADPGASLPVPFFVDVALMQEVTLPRAVKTRTPVQTPTWSLNRLGMVSADRLRMSVTERVDEFVDQFIRAYQSVNPKP
jgi:hypothetical protein